jgi:pumilio family protein 6
METTEETSLQSSKQTDLNRKISALELKNKKRGIKRKISSSDVKRELKERQKLRRKERKLARPNAETVFEAKKIWEEMRIKKIDSEKRTTLINKLMNLIKGKIYEIVFKNDASRVVQCAFRYGNLEQKEIIFNELKDHIIPLAKNEYGHWLLIKMLMYGNKEQRNYIIKKCYGLVRKLHSHRNAAEVLEYIYTDIANAQQKAALVEEFYSPEFSLFKVDEKRTLNDILKMSPEKKDEITKFMGDYFRKFIDRGGPALSYNITHVPLLQYLQYASDKERREMAVLLEKSLPLILHTKEGSRIAVYCVNYGNAKNRKAIIKSFKGLVPRICKEEFGHVVLLRIFDVVDDTVIVNKIILSEIKANLLDLIQDKYGRLVILFLLTPKNKRYFPPSTLELLQPLMISSETDPNTLVSISKKDPEIRRLELLNYISKDLVALCKKYTYRLITHLYAREVFLETLLLTEGEDKTQLFQNILNFIDFDPQQMAKRQQDEDVEADSEQRQQKLQQQRKGIRHYVQFLRNVTYSAVPFV